jgi:hypothetical protein
MITELPIETIVLFLKELPKGKEYETDAIRVARGKYKYKNTLLKRLKKLIYG